MKDTEDDTNRWNDISHSWIGRSNTVKMTVLLKTICRFSEIPMKMQWQFSQN